MEIFERRPAQGDEQPCMSCGGNDGYGPPPHHKPDCYFASDEDAAAGGVISDEAELCERIVQLQDEAEEMREQRDAYKREVVALELRLEHTADECVTVKEERDSLKRAVCACGERPACISVDCPENEAVDG